MTRSLLTTFIFLSAAALEAQTPNWIWHSNTSTPTAFFRKTFRTPPLLWNARLTASADDQAQVFLNGVLVAECKDWRRPLRSEVSVRLNQGENVIAVRAQNAAENAGVLIHLNLLGQTNLVSDGSWLVSTNEEPNWSALAFNASHWAPVKALAPHGEGPWGDVLNQSSATPAESLKLLPNFKAELVRSAQPGEGSWICLTFDPQGRAIISPEGDARPLLRLTLAGGTVSKAEPIAAPARFAMGLLHAFDSLYLNARGPQGPGLYRLTDTNKNDLYETNELQFIKRFDGGSEHGYHGLALGPDDKIYILNGNGTKLPQGLSANSPYRNYAEDALSGERSSEQDQDGSKAPACYVLRYDPRANTFDLFAAGMRNAYDLDFNKDGELFSFDSDMEWDWGTPWYKATRILHIVSGGEYGWRDGTRMWSDEFEDGLPPAAYIGIGSPTGVKFGARAKFPERYRDALYALDWSYGRIMAVHLQPDGSSYTGKWETFVEGRPLNLTSISFSPDGAMYFVTGGRGIQSGLYRVTYTGAVDSQHPVPLDRKRRERLAAFHGRDLPGNIEVIWPQLASKDRFIRHAAAVALESQNPQAWRKAALDEADPNLALPALRTLVRVTESSTQSEILRALQRFPHSSLNPAQQVQKLRILEISISRHGIPSGELASALSSELAAAYPSESWPLNRELTRLTLRLNTPGAVPKAVRLLAAARTQEEQMHYLEQLRNVRDGWTLEDRRALFSWFNKPRDPQAHPPEIFQYFQDVGRAYVDGAYFNRYVRDFRREAIATLSDTERQALGPLLAAPVVQGLSVPASSRSFVREWKLDDLLPELLKDRVPNLDRGRQAFVDAQCLMCHRFGNDGGMSGPELTGAGSKYAPRDILESIVEPSKILSDQYQNHTVVLKDGDSYSGRLVSETPAEIVLETDRVSGGKEKFNRKNVEVLRPSPVSAMPEGLVNTLSKDEILDLIAYLRR